MEREKHSILEADRDVRIHFKDIVESYHFITSVLVNTGLWAVMGKFHNLWRQATGILLPLKTMARSRVSLYRPTQSHPSK